MGARCFKTCISSPFIFNLLQYINKKVKYKNITVMINLTKEKETINLEKAASQSDAKKEQFKGTHSTFYGSLREFAYTENFTAPPEIIDGWENIDLGDLLNYIEVKYKLGIRAGYGVAFTLGEWDIEIRDFGVCGTRNDFYTGFPVFHMSQRVGRTSSMKDVDGECLSYAVYYAFQYINADYPAKKWNAKYWNNGPTLTLNEYGTWQGERWEHLSKDDC